MSITTPERAKAFSFFTVMYPTGSLSLMGLRGQVDDFQAAYHMACTAAEVIDEMFAGDIPAFAEIEGHTRRTDQMSEDEFYAYLEDPANSDVVAWVLADGRVVANEDSDDPEAVELLEALEQQFANFDAAA